MLHASQFFPLCHCQRFLPPPPHFRAARPLVQQQSYPACRLNGVVAVLVGSCCSASSSAMRLTECPSQLRSNLHGARHRRRCARRRDRRYLGCARSACDFCRVTKRVVSIHKYFKFSILGFGYAALQRMQGGSGYMPSSSGILRNAGSQPCAALSPHSNKIIVAGTSAVSWAAMLSTFRGSHCALVRIRGRDDATNSFIAGSALHLSPAARLSVRAACLARALFVALLSKIMMRICFLMPR